MKASPSISSFNGASPVGVGIRISPGHPDTAAGPPLEPPPSIPKLMPGGATSSGSREHWGWYESDGEGSEADDGEGSAIKGSCEQKEPSGESSLMDVMDRMDMLDIEGPPPHVVTAPAAVLEESLSTQSLYRATAQTRPVQPSNERSRYETEWIRNFNNSNVTYSQDRSELCKRDERNEMSSDPALAPPASSGIFYRLDSAGGGKQERAAAAELEILKRSAAHPVKAGDPATERVHRAAGGVTVIYKVPNAYGTTVSKSFSRGRGTVTASVSIASFRVCGDGRAARYAEFHVVFCLGGYERTVGVWKRYSDFVSLAGRVGGDWGGAGGGGCTGGKVLSGIGCGGDEEADDEDPGVAANRARLINALTSWRLLQKRKKWFRCLDSSYLSLKVFLLERFLHDVLFESESPELLRKWILPETYRDQGNQRTQ